VSLSIRSATSDDLHAILAIDDYCRTHPERKKAIERWIGSGACYVAIVDGNVVGYAALEYSFYDNGFIAMLTTTTDHRRQGIGTALVRHIESVCMTPKLFTSTNESNKPMQALLAKLGYQPSGIIENLDEGDAELVYVKRVP